MSIVQMSLQKIATTLKIPKTRLNYYAGPELRLIKPVQKHPESNFYVYDLNEVKRVIKRVEDLKKRGYTLKDAVQKL